MPVALSGFVAAPAKGEKTAKTKKRARVIGKRMFSEER
jgi:hypothetical protein